MQAPQQVTSGNMFGDAASFAQESSSSIFSPPTQKSKKRCNSNKTIEVSDTEDDDNDERKAKDFIKKNKT